MIADEINILSGTEVRAIVRHRDGYRCVDCGTTQEEHIVKYGKRLQVHRKTPGTVYRVDDCETVCIACHGPRPKLTYRRSRKGRSVVVPARVPPELGKRLQDHVDTIRPKTTMAAVLALALDEYLDRVNK